MKQSINENSPLWSRIGLGTGRLVSLGRGTTQKMVNDIVQKAIENGVKVIDTADSYTSGDCERMLGKAVKSIRRDCVVVSKAGYRYGDLPKPISLLNPLVKKACQVSGIAQCFDPKYINHHIHRSLQRLQTDYLDCFLLHNPCDKALANEALIELLNDLLQTGKARSVGVSTDQTSIALTALNLPVVTVLQTPANLAAAKSFEAVWRESDQRGVHVIGNHVFHQRPALVEAKTHEQLLQRACRNIPDGTILVGTRSCEHLLESIKWAEISDRMNP